MNNISPVKKDKHPASKAWLFAAILPVLNVVFALYAMSA
jgi:hypothetical protein